MSLEKLIAADYGQPIELTFIDVDTDAAADISGYTTTIQMVFTDQDGTVTAKTETFKTDGSDGIIEYTVENAYLTEGSWKVRGRVKAGNATLSTEEYSFKVYG
jgi:hypothetical protein